MAGTVNNRKPPGAAFDAILHGNSKEGEDKRLDLTAQQGGIRVTVYLVSGLSSEIFFQRTRVGNSHFDPFQQGVNSFPMSPADLALIAMIAAQARRGGNGASFENATLRPALPHQVMQVVGPQGGPAALPAAFNASRDEKQEGCCARVVQACTRAWGFFAKAWSGKQD